MCVKKLLKILSTFSEEFTENIQGERHEWLILDNLFLTFLSYVDQMQKEIGLLEHPRVEHAHSLH